MIRKGSHADVPFMRSMLAHAYGWRVNQLDADIPLTRYVENWGRAGDIAVIAAETGNRVGAAWLRVFREDSPGLRLHRRADAGADDLRRARRAAATASARSCSTRCSRRRARQRHQAVSLSVEADSPAVAFYERNGFEAVGESDGGLVMRREL